MKYKQEKDSEKNIIDIRQKIFVFIKSDKFKNYFSKIKTASQKIDKHFDEIQSEATKRKVQKNLIVIDVSNLEAILEAKLRE